MLKSIRPSSPAAFSRRFRASTGAVSRSLTREGSNRPRDCSKLWVKLSKSVFTSRDMWRTSIVRSIQLLWLPYVINSVMRHPSSCRPLEPRGTFARACVAGPEQHDVRNALVGFLSCATAGRDAHGSRLGDPGTTPCHSGGSNQPPCDDSAPDRQSGAEEQNQTEARDKSRGNCAADRPNCISVDAGR